MRDEELLPCFTLTRAELAALVVLKGVRDEGLRVWLQQHNSPLATDKNWSAAVVVLARRG
jgi:hypothetical protein